MNMDTVHAKFLKHSNYLASQIAKHNINKSWLVPGYILRKPRLWQIYTFTKQVYLCFYLSPKFAFAELSKQQDRNGPVKVTRMQGEKNKRPACTANVFAPVWEKGNYVHRTVHGKVATKVRAKTKK